MSNSVRLIARREIVTRVAQRGYRIGLAVSLLVVVLACVLPSLFGGDDSTSKYDVTVAEDAIEHRRYIRTSFTKKAKAAH